MPPIMANFKDAQVHKDKYLDTSTKIFSLFAMKTVYLFFKYVKCQGHKV